MPSGSKKRKAAKRKKAIQVTNHVNGDNNNQGNVDIESQDERESDGSELSSPASHGHSSHHHSFKDDSTGSEKNDPPTCTTIMADSKYMEQVGPVNDNAFQLERELKSEDFDSNNHKVELIQSEKDSHSENDSGSRTSSSDDESRVCQTKQEEPNASADDLVAASVDVLVTPDVATSVETIEVIENSLAKNTAVSDAFQSASRCDDDKLLPVTGDAFVGKRESAQQAVKENKARVLSIDNENVDESLVVGETSNGDKDVKDSRVPESSENQPLLGSAAPAPMVERSSWLSCCGLLDAITVSNK